MRILKWAALLPVIALGCLIGLVSTIAVRAEPETCAAKRAVVLEYIDAATALPDMSEEDRRALRGALLPVAEVICNKEK